MKNQEKGEKPLDGGADGATEFKKNIDALGLDIKSLLSGVTDLLEKTRAEFNKKNNNAEKRENKK